MIIIIKKEKTGNAGLEGRHVLIYHNKDRLGPSVQLIVAPFYTDDDDDDIDHHDDDHCDVQ